MMGEHLTDILNRGWVFWTFVVAFIWSLIGGRGGPPSSPSAQLSFDFVEGKSRKLKFKRYYPYTTPFGNS